MQKRTEFPCLAGAAAVVTLSWFAMPQFSVAAEKVTLTLTGGRVVKTCINNRPDASVLWTFGRSVSTMVVRPIPWDSIQSAEVVGRRLSVNQLRDFVRNRGGQNKQVRDLEQPESAKIRQTRRSGGGTLANEALVALGFVNQSRDAFLP